MRDFAEREIAAREIAKKQHNHRVWFRREIEAKEIK
jgi:hypothetical protein